MWRQRLQLTVFVHGKEGRHQHILQNEGKVVLHLGTSATELVLNENSEATFKEIPGDYNGKKVLVTISFPPNYQSTQPDSLYELKHDAALHIETGLSSADKIFGRVFDTETNSPLDSVRVSIRNSQSFTDATGRFELSIPADIQAQFQKVAFLENGYFFKEMDSVRVDVQKEMTVVLQKKS